MLQLEKVSISLSEKKCDSVTFQKNIDRVDKTVKELNDIVYLTKTHCHAIDNYLDKYEPVRIQTMIGDTIRASLSGKGRRRHELYDNDKIGLLY